MEAYNLYKGNSAKEIVLIDDTHSLTDLINKQIMMPQTGNCYVGNETTTTVYFAYSAQMSTTDYSYGGYNPQFGSSYNNANNNFEIRNVFDVTKVVKNIKSANLSMKGKISCWIYSCNGVATYGSFGNFNIAYDNWAYTDFDITIPITLPTTTITIGFGTFGYVIKLADYYRLYVDFTNVTLKDINY